MKSRVIPPITALLIAGCASTQDVEVPFVYSGPTLTGQVSLGYQRSVDRLCGWPFDPCDWKVDTDAAHTNALAACENAGYRDVRDTGGRSSTCLESGFEANEYGAEDFCRQRRYEQHYQCLK